MWGDVTRFCEGVGGRWGATEYQDILHLKERYSPWRTRKRSLAKVAAEGSLPASWRCGQRRK